MIPNGMTVTRAIATAGGLAKNAVEQKVTIFRKENDATRTIEADLEKMDEDAVMEHYLHGKPIDPEVYRRVQERAARITEEIRRVHGVIDDATFDALFHDDDEA